MKSLIVAMMLVAGPAMAGVFQTDELVAAAAIPREEIEVDYISWCEGNSVMAQNQKGDVIERANCTDYGRTCKATQSYRGYKYVVTAMCEAQ
ncbi:hypothetical protein D3C87_86340 [compost metagenome]